MYEVGIARADDVRHLPEIEERAAELFHALPTIFELPLYMTPLEHFEQAYALGQLLTARVKDGPVVGFALLERRDGVTHLEELDVLPEHGRKGVGATLVRHVCDWAKAMGDHAVTLCTFRDVPWNAPFYERMGFRRLAPEEHSAWLQEHVDEETRKGLRPELRVAMRYEIGIP